MRLGGWQDRYAQAACCENFAISDGNRQISPDPICLSRLGPGPPRKQVGTTSPEETGGISPPPQKKDADRHHISQGAKFVKRCDSR